MSLSKLMKRELAAGNTFASPRLLRYVSYSACVTKTRVVGRSPSSGRCPRSWALAVTVVAATAEPPRSPSRIAIRPAVANALFIGDAQDMRPATRFEVSELSLGIVVRHALLRIGAVGLASAVTAVVLFGVGRLILTGDLGVAMPSLPQTNASPSPTPTISPAVLSDIAAPKPSPTPSPTSEPSLTATTTPTKAPLALTSFAFLGRTYVGIVVPDVGRTFVAPFAGTIEVRIYQFIDGEVRVGSNVPNLPFYPYISVVAADKKITYRPGTMPSVTEVLARDGASVAAGDPLFRLIALTRSSWTTFYNSSAPYQVVVSLQAIPSGRDLDPTIYVSGT